jgi:hypothetical protein
MKRSISVLSVAVAASVIPGSAWAQRLTRPMAVPNALHSAVVSQAAPAGEPASPPQAAKGPQFKTREEYDAYEAILKAASPEAKISAANAFLAKYPKSDFKALADMLKVQSYVQLKNVHGAIAAAKSALNDNPNPGIKVTALHYLALVFPYIYKPRDPDGSAQLSQAQSQGQEGLQLLQQVQKPPNASQEAFEAQIKSFRADFNRVLGFVALEQKDSASAINYLKAAEQDNP